MADFLDDVEQHFQFLVDTFGFAEGSSSWQSHRTDSMFGEHVATAVPQVTYNAPMRHVSIRHDPQGAVRVIVTRMYPALKSATVEQIAREAGATTPASFHEDYDMASTTAGGRIRKLAEGLRAFGEDWLTEPTPP